MLSAVILILGVGFTYAEIHTHQYFYTSTSGLPQFPEFTIVGLVDGQQINYYDSQIKQLVPKHEWVKEAVDPDFWNRNTQIAIGTEPSYKNNIQVAKERFNQTGGVHTFQQMYGCELQDDGTTRGYMQFGYDGEDLLSFDKNTLTWTAVNPQAVISKIKWDADKGLTEITKSYLENICIEWLKKYVSFGKKSLERKDAPQVSLLQKDSSSPVICHATGFYPNNIMMTWKKYNEDLDEDVEITSTLPNEDGSYQKSISLSVNPEEWKKNPDIYKCVIQHGGAEKEIVYLLNEKNIKSNNDSTNIIAIVVGCVVALALLAAIIGFIVWKKSNGYRKANASDTDSENSGQLPQAK